MESATAEPEAMEATATPAEPEAMGAAAASAEMKSAAPATEAAAPATEATAAMSSAANVARCLPSRRHGKCHNRGQQDRTEPNSTP
jgi:hypothetical protein